MKLCDLKELIADEQEVRSVIVEYERFGILNQQLAYHLLNKLHKQYKEQLEEIGVEF
tara:strand:+ start:1431 stop:1601 length:171 start_codon:yes stop_codon:yes gene_type:complete